LELENQNLLCAPYPYSLIYSFYRTYRIGYIRLYIYPTFNKGILGDGGESRKGDGAGEHSENPIPSSIR
jgi:hypothetical protein